MNLNSNTVRDPKNFMVCDGSIDGFLFQNISSNQSMFFERLEILRFKPIFVLWERQSRLKV